jgi:hypothetical protein
MPELPDRPDIDQLRRQARELLRAATHGEAHAIARLRTVSDRVTLSAAHLAVAREYSYRSWPALQAEVERRRLPTSAATSPSPGGDERGPLGAPEQWWSFGGATPIATSAGLLLPEALVVGAGHATLYASLTPPGNGQPAAGRQRRMPAPRMPFARWALRRQVNWARRRRADAAVTTIRTLIRPDELAVIDDQGVRYTLRPGGMSGKIGRSGEPAGLLSVSLGLDPVPGRGIGWLELRCRDGSATRLLPSARPAVQVSQLTPTSESPAERELVDQALSLIDLQLTNAGNVAEDFLRRQCPAALAKTSEIQRSGELDPASELPDQLRQLCAVLTEHRPADRLPASWSGMLGAARRADGPGHHLDIGATLPPIDGVTVQLGSLISWPDIWRLYLRATPTWWGYSEDGRRKWFGVTVHAEDDRGGTYLSTFDGSTGHTGHEEPGHEKEEVSYEELALRFRPRLDPLAHALTLTFRGANEEVLVDLRLESTAISQRQ